MTQPNLAALGAELRAAEEQVASEAHAAPSDSEIHALVQTARRTLAARRRRQRVAVACGSVLAAAALVLLVLFRPRPSALEFTVSGAPGVQDAWLRAEGAALPLEFSDGSRVELAPEASARVGKLAPTEARIVLESGRLQVWVVPREGTRWTFAAGHFEVLVTGTAFALGWEPESERLSLSMQEGRVVVRGPGLDGPVTVSAGGRLVVSGRERHAVLTAANGERTVIEHTRRAAVSSTAVSSGAAPPPQGPPAHSSPARPTQPVDRARAWRELADAGQHREAMEAVDHAGFEATCQRLGAQELLKLADVARLAGQPARASAALHAVRERFPSSPEAALVAYTFGRQAFDGAGNYAAAAKWFETYLTEAPRGPLAREALGRLMEAQQRQGRLPATRATAQQYLAAYPTGPHRDIARRLVESAR